VSDTLDEADDGTAENGVPGVPPAPSVTPGSAPPPPGGVGPHPRSRRGCLVVGGLAALVVLVGLVVLVVVAKGVLGNDADDLAKRRQEVVDETGIETGSTDVDHPPQRDIRLGACEFDPDGGVQASGTLTNWTSEPSDYRISLSFLEGNGGTQGTEFGATVVTVEGVESHATTNWAASVPTRPQGTYTCRVVRIDRWNSGQPPPADVGP